MRSHLVTAIGLLEDVHRLRQDWVNPTEGSGEGRHFGASRVLGEDRVLRVQVVTDLVQALRLRAAASLHQVEPALVHEERYILSAVQEIVGASLLLLLAVISAELYAACWVPAFDQLSHPV